MDDTNKAELNEWLAWYGKHSAEQQKKILKCLLQLKACGLTAREACGIIKKTLDK